MVPATSCVTDVLISAGELGALETIYEYLKSSIPADHCRQSRAIDLVIARIRAGFRPAKVLDLGCGAGNTVDFFRSRLPESKWVGVDVEQSPEVATRTRSDATFVTFDGVNLPFADGEFDLIYSNQVLEHVRHPERLLSEVHRVLSPDGFFIGQTSHLEPFHSFSYWNFTAYGFKEICESANLRLVEIRPGIDGITLVKRAYLGRPAEYSRWFAEESPVNVEIEESARKKSRSAQTINYRKLMYCGQFAFACQRKRHRDEEKEPSDGFVNRLAQQVTGKARRAMRARTDNDAHMLALPGGMLIEYSCPRRFHIPRALSGVGLAGYEPVTMAAFLASAESVEGAVFDVGANIGIYALAAASALGKTCIAFEPFPAAADVLEDIVKRYQLPVSLRRAALAENSGATTFYLSARSDMSNSLNPEFREHRGEIVVETTTLDKESLSCRLGVVKIDTETTEMDVLRGGRHVFERDRPSVIIEILDDNLAMEARGFFASYGYTITELGKPDVWRRISGSSGEVILGDRRNWLASPQPLGDKFFERAAFWAANMRDLPAF
ncbi:MAG: FkbM family methyltransferase [Parvibaculum sp.]|nr:FkbM family methyltransferase [Parvibaculum sp.]